MQVRIRLAFFSLFFLLLLNNQRIQAIPTPPSFPVEEERIFNQLLDYHFPDTKSFLSIPREHDVSSSSDPQEDIDYFPFTKAENELLQRIMDRTKQFESVENWVLPEEKDLFFSLMFRKLPEVKEEVDIQ